MNTHGKAWTGPSFVVGVGKPPEPVQVTLRQCACESAVDGRRCFRLTEAPVNGLAFCPACQPGPHGEKPYHGPAGLHGYSMGAD